MAIFNAILGAILLFFGRKLYWLFVGIAGFLVGLQLAEVFLADQTAIIRLIVAVGAGLLGAILAVIAQRVAFALGGFYAGGYLALSFGPSLIPNTEPMLWLIIGGILGAVVAALVMDWAIIALSCLVGAGAIVAAFVAAPMIEVVVFLVLFAIGFAFQARELQPVASDPPPQ